MSIKLYTVKCPIHGQYEAVGERSTSACPIVCSIMDKNGRICNQPLSRVYDPPNVHYKGTGWAGKEK